MNIEEYKKQTDKTFNKLKLMARDCVSRKPMNPLDRLHLNELLDEIQARQSSDYRRGYWVITQNGQHWEYKPIELPVLQIAS